MGALLSLLPLILPLLSELPSLILKAEQAFSGKAGSGSAKKDLVLQLIDTALELEQQITGKKLTAEQVAVIHTAVASLIDTIVNALNVAKVFTSTSGGVTK